jgi:hypothetical protein
LTGTSDATPGLPWLWPETADEARDAVVEYLKNDMAYAKPYDVSQVEPHDEPKPYVVFMNWGDWDDWPPEHETSFPTD